MLSKSLLILAAAALSVASPTPRGRGHGSCKPPTLPVNGGDRELTPAPSTGADAVSLKYIGLGLGIQNYSCADAGATGASTGALAMLYDVTSLYPGQSKQSLSQDEFNALSTTALHGHDIPLNFNANTAGQANPQYPGAVLPPADPFTKDAPLKLHGMRPIPFLGHHYFDSTAVPNFVLPDAGIHVVAAKLDAIPAPADADAGIDGTGAVDWLQLGDKDGMSVGATYVYRVITAGGNSHGCANAGTDTTSYSAFYWFYG